MNNNSSNFSVLVVDDNPAGLYTTSRVLKSEGFQIYEASTGMGAIDKTMKFLPDVVLLDVKLPDMSGFEVCKIIKTDNLTTNIPVIHLSATYLDSESRVQGLEGGADAYLTHPTEPKVLVATIHAVLRIRQAEAQLHAAAIRWQTTFDAINDCVCLIDVSGNVLQSNKAFNQIVNLNKNQIHGNKLSLIASELQGYTPEFFLKHFEQDLNDNQELLFKDRWFLTSINSIEDENGVYSGSVFKMTDITSQKISEAQLQKTMEELERSNKELEQFAFVASHDLQEPLRMISIHLQLIEKKLKGQLDQGTVQNISFAVEGSQRMHNLISDLLEYSRVATKANNFVSVELESVLGKVLTDLQVAISSSNAVINHDAMPEVCGDDVQLGQLFQNLIANAIKFRSEEPPLIHISTEEKQTEWLFCVSDNGIGIDPQFFDKIFIIFQRLQSEYSGTGIGLAICKKIVERHGGRIWVEKKSGKGTTFCFTLSKKL